MNILRLPLLLCAASLLPLSAADLWLTDLEAGKKAAVEQKKDLLLSFTGSDWCPGCIMLKEQVFDQPEFSKGVKDEFILVELDYPKDRAKSDPARVQANELLLDQYFVEEFPTLILADEHGRPFARTALSSYEPIGAADYVKHLVDLRQRRTLRDEALSAAEKLEGVEKAKALLGAIADFPDLTVDAFYSHIVEAILKADGEDKTGFRRAREYRKAVNSYEENVATLFNEGKFKEAMALAKSFIAQHDPTGYDRQHILMAELMALVELGEKKPAFALLQKIKAIAPESEIGLEVDRLKGRMEDFFKGEELAAEPGKSSTPGPEGGVPATEDQEKPSE